MYEEQIKALRKVDEYDSGYAKLMYDAADAIEAQDRHILTLQHEMMAEAESHIAEVNRLNMQIEVLSKKEKTTKPDERLTPKKPKVSVDTLVCPECWRAVEFQEMLGENIIFHGYHNFCPNCGQAIDWEEQPEEEA